jgi:hypothetical protein
MTSKLQQLTGFFARTLSRSMARPIPGDLFLPAAADPLHPGTGGDLQQLTHGTDGDLQWLTHGTGGDRRSPRFR